MARTPSKKKRGSGTGTSLRRGPRDPRQHVHSSGSGTGVPFNRGRRRGTHGVANSNTHRATSLPPILERNPVLEGIALDLTDAPDSGGVARALGVPASASTHRNRDDGVVVLDGADGSGLRELITFEGDENPDVAIGRALLESKMVEQLKRKANAQMLGFTPDHYKELVENLNGFPPAYSRRDQLIAMALQVDPGGGVDGAVESGPSKEVDQEGEEEQPRRHLGQHVLHRRGDDCLEEGRVPIHPHWLGQGSPLFQL